MPKRQIKKTQIIYEGQKEKPQKRSRSRSREKVRVEVIDGNSRKARLAAMKNKKKMEEKQEPLPQEKPIKIAFQEQKPQETRQEVLPMQKKNQPVIKPQIIEESESEDEKKILMKPIFIAKQDRNEDDPEQNVKQLQRKKKALKYTTKLLLKQNREMVDKSDEEDELNISSDDENRTDIPDDNDNKNEQYEYELWKVRELKRIRRDRQERQRVEVEKAEIQRRRKMNNEEILLENKVMGSDLTDNNVQTKYVYMQKYYHKGAFYQDSNDPIFKRDFNLPTPLQMQDKSSLPQILQKRIGKFGTKGQSKYKHLSAEDTSNFDPQFRSDERIMSNWKKKMAGYKGSGNSNI